MAARKFGQWWLGLGLLWPAAGADFQPYLQRVTAESATVVWTAPQEGEGEVLCAANRHQQVRVRAAGSPLWQDDSGGSKYHYVAGITGLDPGLEYDCRVRWNGSDLGEAAALRLRTASWRKFRFLAFGDSGARTEAQFRLARLMEQEDAALALHTGDLAYPAATFERLDTAYFQVYSNLFRRTPMFPSPGNHEYWAPGALPYYTMHQFPASAGAPESERGQYYSFDWGPIHFVSLDSVNPLRDAAQGRNGMLRWLEQDLQSTRLPWRIVYFHHPPYATGPNSGDPFAALVRSHVVPILERYGVQLVLNGHEHSYQRTYPWRAGLVVPQPEGTVYVVTGGGGGGLYPVDPAGFLAHAESRHHYVRVDVDGDELHLAAVGAGGEVFDQTVLRLSPAMRIHRVTALGSARESFAPGGWIEIIGSRLAARDGQTGMLPLPHELESTRVSWKETPLRLLSVSPGRIVAQLPFGGEGRGTLKVENPEGTCEFDLRLQPAAPVLFPTVYHGGTNKPVSQEDPIDPGGWATLYGTGFGEPLLPLAAGEAAPGSPLRHVQAEVMVLFGSENVRPAFAGLSPGLVGIYQIDFQAPAVLPSGDNDLVISTAGKHSNTLRIAVR